MTEATVSEMEYTGGKFSVCDENRRLIFTTGEGEAGVVAWLDFDEPDSFMIHFIEMESPQNPGRIRPRTKRIGGYTESGADKAYAMASRMFECEHAFVKGSIMNFWHFINIPAEYGLTEGEWLDIDGGNLDLAPYIKKPETKGNTK